MTTKQKAEDLVNSYRIILMNEDTECGNEILCTSIAKQCAIIAVKEILEGLKEYDERTENYLKEDFPDYFSFELQNMEQDLRFYEQVKKEIEKL
jgi:hypothetical protein